MYKILSIGDLVSFILSIRIHIDEFRFGRILFFPIYLVKNRKYPKLYRTESFVEPKRQKPTFGKEPNLLSLVSYVRAVSGYPITNRRNSSTPRVSLGATTHATSCREEAGRHVAFSDSPVHREFGT